MPHHKLRTVRIEHDLTIGQLATLARVGKTTISKIETCTNEYKVNIATASLLAHALDLQVPDLFDEIELSWDTGRPPSTGTPLKKRTPNPLVVHKGERTCSSCFTLTRPISGCCTNCETPIPVSLG